MKKMSLKTDDSMPTTRALSQIKTQETVKMFYLTETDGLETDKSN